MSPHPPPPTHTHSGWNLQNAERDLRQFRLAVLFTVLEIVLKINIARKLLPYDLYLGYDNYLLVIKGTQISNHCPNIASL